MRRQLHTRAHAQRSMKCSHTKSYTVCPTCTSSSTKRLPDMPTREQDDEQARTADGEPNNRASTGNTVVDHGSLLAQQGSTIQTHPHANEISRRCNDLENNRTCVNSSLEAAFLSAKLSVDAEWSLPDSYTVYTRVNMLPLPLLIQFEACPGLTRPAITLRPDMLS